MSSVRATYDMTSAVAIGKVVLGDKDDPSLTYGPTRTIHVQGEGWRVNREYVSLVNM